MLLRHHHTVAYAGADYEAAEAMAGYPSWDSEGLPAAYNKNLLWDTRAWLPFCPGSSLHDQRV